MVNVCVCGGVAWYNYFPYLHSLCVTGWKWDGATKRTSFCHSRCSGAEEAAGRQRWFPASTATVQLPSTVRHRPSFSFVFIWSVCLCLHLTIPVTHHVPPDLFQTLPRLLRFLCFLFSSCCCIYLIISTVFYVSSNLDTTNLFSTHPQIC